jgi:hypothetical protein
MLLKFFKGFRGLIETAEAASEVTLKSRKPVPRPQWNRRIRIRGLIETAEATIPNEYLEFLGEFEGICETALVRQSGPLGALIDEKQRSKISWHCPFR